MHPSTAKAVHLQLKLGMVMNTVCTGVIPRPGTSVKHCWTAARSSVTSDISSTDWMWVRLVELR